MNPFDDFLIAAMEAQTKTRNHGQILFLGFDTGGQHRMDARGVNRHRLLGENVLAGINGRLQVDRAEVRRRAQQHDIHATGEQFLVSLETDKATFFGHLDLRCKRRIGLNRS